MPKMANFFRTKLMYTIRYHAQKLELGLYPEKKNNRLVLLGSP